MTKRKFYLTRIADRSLAQYLDLDASLSDIARQTVYGDWSGRHVTKEQDREVSGVECVDLLIEHGSDPDFFGLDGYGNDI